MDVWNMLRILSALCYAVCIFVYAEKLLVLRVRRTCLYPVILAVSALFSFLAADLPVPMLYAAMLTVLFLLFRVFFEGSRGVHAFAAGNFIFHMLCIKGIILSSYSFLSGTTMYYGVHDETINSILGSMLFFSVTVFLFTFQLVYRVERVREIIEDQRVTGMLCSIQIVLNLTLVLSSLAYYLEEATVWIQAYHLLISVMILVGFYTVFQFFVKDQMNRKKEIDIENLKEQIEYETKRYQQQSAYITNLRKIKHDYMGQLRGLQYVLSQKGSEEALKYLGAMSHEIRNGEKTYQKYSDQTFLDAVLQEYAQKAEKRSVRFRASVAIAGAGVNDHDLCIIFTNLLENALEANSTVVKGQRYVELCSRKSGGWTVVTMKNPYRQLLYDEECGLKTTKADREEHGYGMKRVKETVERNGGMFHYTADQVGKIFQVQLMFPQPYE